MFPTLAGYDCRKQLFRDCVAGVTVGALCVPQSMSYAGLAGLPIQNGLYSDLQLAYQAVGHSRHLVVGPVAIMSLLAFECLSGTPIAPLSQEWIVACSLLSLCVGACQLLLAGMGLGARIANALSENTLKAFTASASLTIANTQLPAFLGCWPVGKCLSTPLVHLWTVSAASVLVLESFRLVPHPVVQKLGALVVLVTGVLAVYGLGLDVPVVGPIPAGLPTSLSPLYLGFSLPGAVWMRIALFTIPMSLIGFAESFAIAKTGKDELLPNRELFALGLANVWTSALGGYPVSGSFSRSAVNLDAGASSCVSALVAFGLVVLVLSVFTPWLALLPKACVASIVLAAILRLVDVAYVWHHLVVPRRWAELAKYATVFGLGLVAGVEFGLGAGLGFDLVDKALLRRASSTTTATISAKESDEEELLRG